MNPDDTGDWNEYQRLVMSKLESLEMGQKDTRTEVGNLRTDMAVLKVKSGLWGALAGSIPAAILLMLHFFTGKKQ